MEPLARPPASLQKHKPSLLPPREDATAHKEPARPLHFPRTFLWLRMPLTNGT